MDTNKKAINESAPQDTEPTIYINSQNNKEIAKKIKLFSKILMERNYLAYKELADK